MLPQQYCLRWKYHHSNLQTMFSQLLDRGCFCDVTLACEGQILRAHRVVLCACSTYFDTLLTNYTSDKDTIIIMKDAKFADIKCLIEFMYKGEINVEHASLASLLKTAEELKIKGLAEVSWRDDEVDVPQSDSDSKFLDNVEHMSGASESMSQAPLLTPIPSPNVQDNPHLGQKRKRGRPPLDEEYDVFSTPKISFVEGATPVQSFGEVTHPHEPEIIEESEKDPLAKDDWMERQNGNGDHHSHHHSSHHHHLSLEGKSDGSEMKMAKILPKSEPYDDLMDQEDNESTSDPGSNSGFFLTPKEEEMWKDVVKMDAYLAKGRRPQFWEEPFTKRVMEAIKTKELEMKKAAQLLGVSYGTLYGRYRETYGCLKHPYRGPSMVSRYREIWADKVPADFIDISSHHDSSGLDAQWVR